MRKQKGFSLIELLIVVAIILIIAAIAIPNLLRSRMAANEASAVGSVRTINTAETTFASQYPECGFPGLLSDLVTPPTGAGLIDAVLGGASGKSGYKFTLNGTGGIANTACTAGLNPPNPNTGYTILADPLTTSTGTRHFYSDQSGVIRYNATAAAAAADAPLQ